MRTSMKILARYSLLGFLLVACASETNQDVLGAPSAPEPEQPVVEAPPPATPTPEPPKKEITPACTPDVPRTVPLQVAVQPDAGTEPFSSIIASAKKDLRVMVYQMGYGPVLDGLVARAKEGLKVRVILDVAQKDVNQKYMTTLQGAGAEVIWSDEAFTYMHAKVIIADDVSALITTGNYSVSYMMKERNYAVRDSDPADVDVLLKLFDADFARKTPDVSCTRLFVSPINAKQRLLDFIKSAKKEILVESMQLGDWDVRNALAERKAAGVEVRVILADPNWIDANVQAGTFLASKSIPARWGPHMHVKSLIVDGTSAYAGSINFSTTSLTKNREVGLLVQEPTNLASMTATFEKDWAAGTAF
jgi:cardiolipin synthase A/B